MKREHRNPTRRADVTRPPIDVYTDGGCKGNPGVGGWAAVIYDGPTPTEFSGRERHTTNNRMELRAAVEGLKRLETPSKVRLFSDSAYLTNCMNDRWYRRWECNGWKNSKKKPVENADLWRELLELAGHHDVEWRKIPGHDDAAANERCHALVHLAIQHQRGIQDAMHQEAIHEGDVPPGDDGKGSERRNEEATTDHPGRRLAAVFAERGEDREGRCPVCGRGHLEITVGGWHSTAEN